MIPDSIRPESCRWGRGLAWRFATPADPTSPAVRIVLLEGLEVLEAGFKVLNVLADAGRERQER